MLFINFPVKLLICASLCLPVLGNGIPIRPPQVGEARPAWWLDCWDSHVIVIEGIIDYNDKAIAPHISINLDEGEVKKHVGKEGFSLQKSSSGFYLGKIKSFKVLYATPGITSEDLRFERVKFGKAVSFPVLIPTIKHELGYLKLLSNENLRKKRIFVLNYSKTFVMFPLIYSNVIPEHSLKDAKALFTYRRNLDHRDKKNLQIHLKQ